MNLRRSRQALYPKNPMTQLDAQELTLLTAFEAGQLASVATESHLHALRAAARAAMADRQPAAARLCKEWNQVNHKAGGSFADEHSPL